MCSPIAIYACDFIRIASSASLTPIMPALTARKVSISSKEVVMLPVPMELRLISFKEFVLNKAFPIALSKSLKNLTGSLLKIFKIKIQMGSLISSLLIFKSPIPSTIPKDQYLSTPREDQLRPTWTPDPSTSHTLTKNVKSVTLASD